MGYKYLIRAKIKEDIPVFLSGTTSENVSAKDPAIRDIHTVRWNKDYSLYRSWCFFEDEKQFVIKTVLAIKWSYSEGKIKENVT